MINKLTAKHYPKPATSKLENIWEQIQLIFLIISNQLSEGYQIKSSFIMEQMMWRTTSATWEMLKWLKKNYQTQKVYFASIVIRYDMKEGESLINDAKRRLRNYCQHKGLDFIVYDNLNESCLSKRKLCFNKQGLSCGKKLFELYKLITK